MFKIIHMYKLLITPLFLFIIVINGHSQKLNFNLDWKFIKENPSNAQEINFDDQKWTDVSMPHTYNDVDTFDDFAPLGIKGEINQWGGKTWYRKTFIAPQSWQEKTILLEFEAVRQVAKVYCNGVLVGGCENGFIPFGVDLSALLKFGEENVIAVSCDNTFVKDTERKEGINLWHDYLGGAKLPWNNPHWHPAHGGIYRNVFLHVSNQLYFTQPLYNNMKTVGTYVYTTDESRVKATIGIEAEVKNTTNKTQKFLLKSSIINDKGETVLEIDSEILTLKEGQTAIFKNEGVLKNPKLWEPKHPYLYKVINQIVQENEVVDVNKIPLGVRWFDASKDIGFSINDRYIKLEGWGFKSVDGWPSLGAANPDWMHHYTLEMVAKANGNFVRWGHTAGGVADLKSSDQLGLITVQPGVDGEGDVFGHAWDVRIAAWRDMVIYFRNHPSILFWEGGNQSTTQDHASQLKEVVTKFDAKGKRYYGHRRANLNVRDFCEFSLSTEGKGYFRDLPTVEGEYNREESPRRVWDRLTPPYENWHASGQYDLTAEEFAINQLFQYEKIAPLFHGGGANWIFVDSTSGGRVNSEVTRASGELDAMRLPKEAYHVMNVIFSEVPDMHIIGHWNYDEGIEKDIHVVSNADKVKLYLNDKLLGEKKKSEEVRKADDKHSKNEHPLLFTFEKTLWQKGVLKAVGFNKGKKVVEKEIETAGEPYALKLTAIEGPSGLLADGSDVVLFDVEAVDKKGNRCPTFVGKCNFQVEGEGIWRGGYNSGKENSTNHPYLDLESGINRVSVRATRKAGDIVLKATSEGLKAATVKVTSTAIENSKGISVVLPQLPLPQPFISLPLPQPLSLLEERRKKEIVENEYTSKYISDLGYSGPSIKAAVVKTKFAEYLYSDFDIFLKNIPREFWDSEFIQLPQKDWNYSAVDLLQFNVNQDSNVYIAYDTRIEEKEDWLTSEYTYIGKSLNIDEDHWAIYKKEFPKNASVLIGSNTENFYKNCKMLIVFVVPKKK